MLNFLKVLQVAMLTYMALGLFAKAILSAMKAGYLPEWTAFLAVVAMGLIVAAGLCGAAWTIHGFRAD
jgi:hypothetical protein